MSAVILPPDLERFAADAVAQGRYSSLDVVARAAFSLLQRTEAERAAFIESLEEAEAESERDGFFTLEEVMAETAAIIKAAERRKG